MKRISILLGCILLLLTACGGNKLDLDLEKVQNATAEEALKKKSIKNSDYKASDIKITEVCEAVEIGENEFNDKYLVYWKTEDGEFDNNFVMTDNYEIGYGTRLLEKIEDRCINVD